MAMIETNHCVNTGDRGTLQFMEAAVTFDFDAVEREDAHELPRLPSYLSSSEVADCTCPEWCERDHDRD
jgi:hypothetical protein